MSHQAHDRFAFGPYLLEPAQWRLSRNGEVLSLPPKALALLQVLVANAGTLVTKNEILTKVWGDTVVEEANVTFYVAMLRKTLAEPAGTDYIETIKTRGYRFVAPVTVLAGPQTANDSSYRATSSDESDVAPAPAVPPKRWNAGLIGSGLLLVLAIVAGVARLSWGRSDPIDSVVVMPFHAIAPEGDQAYLEAGIAEAIAMRLGNISSMRVPPLAAVRRDEGPFEAGQRLNTQAVLTGTIQRAGDRLQVTTQLSSVRDSQRLWAFTFDTTAGEILTVQNEIAERIAARLGRVVSPADHQQLTRRDTVSGEAYDLFLQGRERWQRRSPETIKQAITLFERAIALDPLFSRAYAGLADCYNIASSGLPPNYRYPRAKEHAEKAVALDPDSAEGHTSLAFMRYKFEWRWEEADREFQQAIRLNPRYALAHHWYGEFLGLMDRPDEAIAELKRALELDPFSLAVRSDMTRPLVRAKRLAEARQVLDEGLKIDPNWYWFPMMMSDILALEGRYRESAEQTWRAMALRAMPAAEIDELRAAFEKGGMPEMLRAQARQLIDQDVKPTSSASYFMASNLSLAFGRLGDREQALRWLETAIDRREDAALLMLTSPAYDSIRDEPRFHRLLERLDLARHVKAGTAVTTEGAR
jgi:DNA-binding winged helix-turn-helix (wHTH) protein/TolB-like protein/tetratricopeptide (TPR) repeat protein